MELHELEVGDGGTPAKRHLDALADRAGRIRRAIPERRVSAGREHHRARAQRAGVRDEADAPPVRHPERERALALAHVDARMREHGAGQNLGDLASRLRAADAVHASSRVTAFEPELIVEADTEIDK